jgi:hypothetical protein
LGEKLPEYSDIFADLGGSRGSPGSDRESAAQLLPMRPYLRGTSESRPAEVAVRQMRLGLVTNVVTRYLDEEAASLPP